MSGILIVLLPAATKLVEYLHFFGKEYVGMGELHGSVEEKYLQEAIELFTGEIYQRPPVRSSVSRRLRVRSVYQFEMLEFDQRRFLFRVRTESGTYIRKLINDIGLYLGVGAHVAELRRTADGPFSEDASFNVLEVASGGYEYFEHRDPALLRTIIRPVEEAVSIFPSVHVKDSAVAALCHGASLAVGGISKLEVPLKVGEFVALKTLKGELIAMGDCVMDSKSILTQDTGIAVKIRDVIMDRNLYPKAWR